VDEVDLEGWYCIIHSVQFVKGLIDLMYSLDGFDVRLMVKGEA